MFLVIYCQRLFPEPFSVAADFTCKVGCKVYGLYFLSSHLLSRQNCFYLLVFFGVSEIKHIGTCVWKIQMVRNLCFKVTLFGKSATYLYFSMTGEVK